MDYGSGVITAPHLSKSPGFWITLATWMTAANPRLDCRVSFSLAFSAFKLPFMCSQVKCKLCRSSGGHGLMRGYRRKAALWKGCPRLQGRGPWWWHDSWTFLGRWMRRQSLSRLQTPFYPPELSWAIKPIVLALSFRCCRRKNAFFYCSSKSFNHLSLIISCLCGTKSLKDHWISFFFAWFEIRVEFILFNVGSFFGETWHKLTF